MTFAAPCRAPLNEIAIDVFEVGRGARGLTEP